MDIDLEEEYVIIPRSGEMRNALRGLLAYPGVAEIKGRVVINCPHPFLGGTSDNPVIRLLLESLVSEQMLVLVWEYNNDQDETGQGVGPDQMTFLMNSEVMMSRPHDLLDLAGVQQWLAEIDLPGNCGNTALAGYSYGGALALLAAKGNEPVLSISPPLSAMPPGRSLQTSQATLIYADDDIALSADETRSFCERSLTYWATEICLPDTDHFYREADHLLRAPIQQWAKAISR